MKLYRFFTAIGALALAAGFTACSDDDEVYSDGFGGVDGQVVLAPTYNESYKFIRIPNSTMAPTLTWSVAPRSRVRATEELTMKFAIDNSLIDSYNGENSTDYVALPEGVVLFVNDEATILPGNNSADTPVTLKVTDNAQLLSQLDTEKKYMVPVRMTEVVKGSARIAVSSSNISYLTFSVEEVLIKTGGTPTGTMVPASDRSGWNMTLAGDYGVYSGSASDPINKTGRYWYIALQGGSLTLDLGKEYTFDGLTFDSSFGSRYYLLLSGVELSYSSDNSTWTSIGTVESSSKTLALYAPITARYVMVYCPSYVLTALTDVSIYEVK